MKFDVVLVEDGGDFWVASKVITCDLTTLDIGEQYLKLSSEASKEIQNALNLGYLVKIPKNLGREVTILDLTIVEVDKLTASKQIAKSLINKFLTAHLESLSIVDIYAYTAIFSKFAARGIFITDENIDKVKNLYTIDKDSLKDRDDAYIDIIMSNSEEDINDLQTLVDAQDKMGRIYEIYKKIRDTQKMIDSSTTIQEVEDAKNIFFHSVMFPGL